MPLPTLASGIRRLSAALTLLALSVLIALAIGSAADRVSAEEPAGASALAARTHNLRPLADPEAALVRAGSEQRYGLVIGADERVVVRDTTEAPWRSVVHLVFFDSSGEATGSCTGTVVGDNVVLTSAHCVHPRTRTGPESILVIPGEAGFGNNPFGSAVATRVTFPAGWADTGQPRYDVALVHLNGAPFGNRLAPYLTLAAVPDAYFEDPGLVLFSAGYPGDKAVGTMWRTVANDWAVDPDFIYMETDTFSGQSGASIIVSHEGRDDALLVGVHRGGLVANVNFSVRLNERVITALNSYCAAEGCRLQTQVPAARLPEVATRAAGTPTPAAATNFLPGTVAGASTSGRLTGGAIPPGGGFGLVVFGGGTSAQLVAASGCPPQTAVFWVTSPAGNFVTYIPAASVATVNSEWRTMFANGIPANTALVARCR